MDVQVEGWRSTPENWREARQISADKLPQLTDVQKEVARKMHISEEDYARSAFAGKLTQETLLEKTHRFAELLERRIKKIKKEAHVESVRLQTTEHRFAVVIRIDGANGSHSMSLRVSEDLIDDLLESSSEDALKRLDGMLERAFALEIV